MVTILLVTVRFPGFHTGNSGLQRGMLLYRKQPGDIRLSELQAPRHLDNMIASWGKRCKKQNLSLQKRRFRNGRWSI